MIAALELQNLVAAAERTGDAHGVGVGFRSATDEAHLLGAGDRIDDGGGQTDAMLVVGEERRAVRYLRLHGRHHVGVAVADEHRTGAEQEIDIFVAAHVPDAGATTFAHHDVGGQVAEAAGGQDTTGQFDQFQFFVATLQFAHRVTPLASMPHHVARRRDRQSPNRTISTVSAMKQTEL